MANVFEAPLPPVYIAPKVRKLTKLTKLTKSNKTDKSANSRSGSVVVQPPGCQHLNCPSVSHLDVDTSTAEQQLIPIYC